MSTTPTPVERAARAHGVARDARFDGLGDTWDDLTPEDRAAECEDMRVALAAALDVEEIARVLCDADRETLDYERCRPDYVGDDPAVAYRPHAAALIEHLTGATR